jgi:predicted RNA-binding Zn ribbon-like protein
VASVVVSGLVIPLAIADHPALNFCNTRAGWGSDAPKEYLHTHAHLTVWARENGLLPPAVADRVRRAGGAEPEAAAAVVARAIALRSALYAVLLGRAGSGDWAVVTKEVRLAAAAHELVPGSHGPASWRLTDESRLDGPVSAVAWAAARLLTSPMVERVAACPGAGCGWVFADPRGRRRWCSMAWCGNRAKARRFAERNRTT